MASGLRKPKKLKRLRAVFSAAFETAVWAALAALVWLLRRLPLRLVFRVGEAAGLGLAVLLPGYRRLAQTNIARALDLPPREARRLAWKNFQTLAANGAASFRLAAMTPEETTQAVEIEGADNLRSAVARGRGVVLAINHLSNWEVYAQLVYHMPETRFGTIYQALRNKKVDALINADRRRRGVQTFDRSQGYAGPLRLLRQGGVLGVLIDQHAGDSGTWMPFFGRLCSTSTLAETLARRAGAPVVPAAVVTVGPGRWRAVFEPALELEASPTGSLSLTLNHILEKQIRRAPHDWFWVHNRWKIPKPEFLLARHRRGWLLPEGCPAHGLKPFRIVARSPNWLGDACMAFDAIRALKSGRPDARLAVLAPAKLAALWRLAPEVEEVIEIGPGEPPWVVAAKLRARFDAAVLFPHSLRSALEVALAGIPRRVGRPGHARGLLLDQILRPKNKHPAPPPQHHADRYNELVQWCGAVLPPPLCLRPSGQPKEKPVVLICPGADYGPAKRWPAAKFRRTIELVEAQKPCRWLVVGTAADALTAEEICQGCQASLENLAGTTSLDDLLGLLQGADALLTNDTGTMHLADLIGVPLVAIFGSTEPKLTGPRGPAAIALRHHVECSPCFLRRCPRDFRCMEAVDPEEAAAALLRLLKAPAARIVHAPPSGAKA